MPLTCLHTHTHIAHNTLPLPSRPLTWWLAPVLLQRLCVLAQLLVLLHGQQVCRGEQLPGYRVQRLWCSRVQRLWCALGFSRCGALGFSHCGALGFSSCAVLGFQRFDVPGF